MTTGRKDILRDASGNWENDLRDAGEICHTAIKKARKEGELDSGGDSHQPG